MKSAIIVAVAAEERRAIAQSLKPTELFAQIHFCGTSKEVDFLLANSCIDIIFYDISTPEEDLLLTAKLIETVDKLALQLVFFSHLGPTELAEQGRIPAGAHCLSYQSSPTTAATLLTRLLREKPVKSTTNQRNDNLLDGSSGIYNRFYFDAVLDQELSRSKLTGRPFSLLLIEPEGQPASTLDSDWAALLPAVTLTIKEQIRTSDLLCRIEKQRLALLLPETSSSNAARVIDRIQRKVMQITHDIPIALRVGLASPNLNNHFNRHGLLTEAEAAL